MNLKTCIDEIEGDPRVGRKSTIDDELFNNFMLKNKEVFQKGMILLKHPFIKICSEKFNVSVRCIFLKIKRFLEKENFLEHEDFLSVSSDNSSSDKNYSDGEISSSPTKIVNLNTEEIENLRPIKQKNSSGRFVTKMPENWTACINELIYNTLKRPCAFTFKKGAIKAGNLKTTGVCA